MNLSVDEKGRCGQYGMSFVDGAMVNLMAPAPIKERIQAKSRVRNGKVVVDDVKLDERDLTLQFQITARTKTDFWANLNGFFSALEGDGTLNITLAINGNTYRLKYISCTQISSFASGIATFALKVNEPNPNNRGAADSDYGISNSI